MGEQINDINGITICTESFGNKANPAILLIMGATCSMVYWDDEFCKRLANTGYFVIRYDHRDVGRSITYTPGSSNYTVIDLANDALGVLDIYNIEQAHIIGMSLGGMIAQIMAVNKPERIQTLTLIASCLYGAEENDRDLPPMDERIFIFHKKGATLDWSDKEAVIDYLVEGSSLMCGPKHPFDKERVEKQVRTEVQRANNILSIFNHTSLTGDDYYEGKIKEISAPTLIIHGTGDTMLPYAHGIALAEEIPHASLLPLEGTGHEIHFNDWDTIIEAIVNHTSTAS
ncbi:alpha/beta fold hydrolase [Priestia taiwanensis]|uniref:Carboxylesterase n=1 Tax=Priestia taiwanensis TaxID=1347902 RepID=A0A917APT8_9BACI|nr:alpha/beta hydrolase [Priestia taiwanensis]MBM7362407.1 pimeloyl-ACP methyl ester carboxylesterase [Priestia taiwanensis]GGE62006.1 carboxylesterase [Priestia taiwanensis]